VTAGALGETAPGATPRYVLLDGLRGLAAMSIVIHHFTAASGQRELFASASIAVDFFFCLSGFVIAHAYHRRLLAGMTFVEYASRRLVRLYPMYAVGLVLGVVAMALGKMQGLTDMDWDDIREAAFLNFVYVPYLNSNFVQFFEQRLVGTLFPFNNPAWSLFFGIVANFIYAAVIRRSSFIPALLMGLSAYALVWAMALFGEAPGWGARNMLGGFPRVFFAFFAGVVIFQLQGRAAGLPRPNSLGLALFIASIFAMPRFEGHSHYWLAATLLAMPLLVALASRATVPRGSLAARLCEYSGAVSYPIFCVHFPLLLLFAATFPHRVGVWTLLLFVVTTWVVSHLLLKYVDLPFRAWLSLKLGTATP
jgi:peptidoglycan/LPS O-acetylase OafA/YrhL